MRNLLEKRIAKRYRNRLFFGGSLGMLLVVALLLAACGGASSSSAGTAEFSANAPVHQAARTTASGTSQDASSSGQNTKSLAPVGPQYLVKSLQVNMLVKDTRQTASELQSWIATTDPRSSSAGVDYEQTYDNLYSVNMTFSVTSAQYP